MRVIIIGAGERGKKVLKSVLQLNSIEVMAIVDKDIHAPGIKYARSLKIETKTDWEACLDKNPQLIINTIDNKEMNRELKAAINNEVIIIPSIVVLQWLAFLEEKDDIINKLKSDLDIVQLVINSSIDGMLCINIREEIMFLNKRAEQIMGITSSEAVGMQITDIIPSSKLPRTLTNRQIELNQVIELKNQLKIISSTIPLIDKSGILLGAIAIFKEKSDVVRMANDVTNLKGLHKMLETIFQCSNEALSLVDEKGQALLINEAFTNVTGITKQQIEKIHINPLRTEVESLHTRVQKTRRPIRGVRLKEGNLNREVIANFAPVIVDGKLKGSVSVMRDMSEIQKLTDELNRARHIVRTLETKNTFADIVGEQEEMKLAIEQAKFGAKTPVTILLRGESGTGRDLFAQAIHNASDRKFNKFIRVNCAVIDEGYLESELFGTEDGTILEEQAKKKGLFEEANNGSIFLDEIGFLSNHMQKRLLHVLMENVIIRIGGERSIPINVRIIAATSNNIEKAMSEGDFIEDLYYRLNRYSISIPPLKDRRCDLPTLCQQILIKLNQEYGRNIDSISNDALQILMDYDWPGNVRELENILGRTMLLMKPQEKKIEAYHLSFLQKLILNKEVQDNQNTNDQNETLADAVERVEADVIKKSLEIHKYNRTKTAKALGISLRSLYYKIEKYNLANNSMF